jgi:WD40 repeat protein
VSHPSPEAVAGLSIAPDRTRALAQSAGGDVRLWQLPPSAAVPLPAVPLPAVPQPAVPQPAVPQPAVPQPAVPGARLLGWVADGVVWVEGATLAVRAIGAPRPSRRWKPHTRPIEHAVISPDGGTVLSLAGNGTALSDVAAGAVRHRRSRVNSYRVECLAAHPDGSRYLRCWKGCLEVDGFGDDDPRWTLWDEFSATAGAGYAPDGRWLAVGAVGGAVQTFDAANRRADGVGVVGDAHAGPVTVLAWASASVLVTGAGSQLRRWRVDAGRLLPLGRSAVSMEITALACVGEDRALVGGASGEVLVATFG